MSVTEGERETKKRQEAEVFRRFNVNPSPASRELPLHKGAMGRCVFSLCAAEKTKEIFGTSKPKVRTFSFCGSAARKHEPSSGRKVLRVSVTKGERGTERRQEAEVFRRFNGNPSPASRELPLHKGAMGRCDFFPLCRRENTKSGFSEFPKPKGCTFKTKDFRRSFSFPAAVGHR